MFGIFHNPFHRNEKVSIADNDNHILEVAGSLITSYVPKEKYIPSLKNIRSWEIAYKKKMNVKNIKRPFIPGNRANCIF